MPARLEPRAWDTCIVVPCFNEATRLHPERFEAFLASHPWAGFCFVDDGSTDGTPAVLRRLRQRSPDRCAVVTLPANQGKGEAVRAGLRAALEREPTRFVGYWDADLAPHLDDLVTMRAVLQRRNAIDIVFAIRMPLLGHQIRRRAGRNLLGRVFAASASLSLRRRFRDTQCGAKLLRATPRLRRALEGRFVSRWLFDLELLLRYERGAPASAKRFDFVYEHPLERWSNVAESKVTPWGYAWALVELPAILWRNARRSRVE